MILVTVNNEDVNLLQKNIGEDLVIKVNSTTKSTISLDKPLKDSKWVFNLAEASGKIVINIKNTSEQNMIVYLNGTTKLSLEINTPPNLNKTGVIFISENNEHNEDANVSLNLEENTSVEVTTLINIYKKEKKINWKINHLKNASFSLARTVGVNNEGRLEHMVNTVVLAPKGGCRQKLKIINFGERANSECDPVLTIENNDIEYASHGATIGTFDKEHLFYLQSKGLDEQASKKLLLNSNVIELLSTIKDEKERAFIATQFLSKVFLN